MPVEGNRDKAVRALVACRARPKWRWQLKLKIIPPNANKVFIRGRFRVGIGRRNLVGVRNGRLDLKFTIHVCWTSNKPGKRGTNPGIPLDSGRGTIFLYGSSEGVVLDLNVLDCRAHSVMDISNVESVDANEAFLCV